MGRREAAPGRRAEAEASAGAARWNHETRASWSLIDANGAATFSSRLAATASYEPTWNSAHVTTAIQAANRSDRERERDARSGRCA